MPRVRIVKGVSEYCKGKGIPVNHWKQVINKAQSDEQMRSSMIASLNENKKSWKNS